MNDLLLNQEEATQLTNKNYSDLKVFNSKESLDGPGISIIDIAKPNAGGWLTSESINVQNFIDWDTYDVTVNQVPIPSAVLLLGSGLLGLLGFKRGRKK